MGLTVNECTMISSKSNQYHCLHACYVVFIVWATVLQPGVHRHSSVSLSQQDLSTRLAASQLCITLISSRKICPSHDDVAFLVCGDRPSTVPFAPDDPVAQPGPLTPATFLFSQMCLRSSSLPLIFCVADRGAGEAAEGEAECASPSLSRLVGPVSPSRDDLFFSSCR